jgi:hypothetical protein
MTHRNEMAPTTRGLAPIDAAVLMKKYIVLLAMINYGNTEQKQFARAKIRELDKTIHLHLNATAFDVAQRNLAFTEEEMDAINQAIV